MDKKIWVTDQSNHATLAIKYQAFWCYLAHRKEVINSINQDMKDARDTSQ